jgi:signal transduction histidine kinase
MPAKLATDERALQLLAHVLSELAEADTLRSDFIGLASHELRTPISVVHGIAATLHLRGDELEAEQVHELRETLFEQTGRLRDLADQLLDLSRIDSKPLPVEPEPFHPRERLDELLPRIAAGRLGDIDVTVDPEHEVTTDAVAFERVAANLIRLFERFSRGDEARRKSTPGAGLGLAIASAYARAVGGYLRYERARPSGARFTFTLPAART